MRGHMRRIIYFAMVTAALPVWIAVARAADVPALPAATSPITPATDTSGTLTLPFTPTGDALFDRYAQAVLERQCTGPATDLPYVLNPTTLPDDVLASWEAEFGGHPRYWQLRCWCHITGKLDTSGWPNLYDPFSFGKIKADAAQYLAEAQQRGIADADTILLYYGLLPDVWEQAHPMQTVDELDQQSAIQLEHEHEQLQRGLLDAAVAAGPDCAWAYWQRALWLLNMGEENAALLDLRAGNRAPFNRLPVPFPLSFVLDQLDAGNVTGSKALSGAILDEGLRLDLYAPAWPGIKLKERIKDNEVRLLLSGDTALAGALHQTACQIALTGRGCRPVYTTAGVCIWMQLDTIMRDCSEGLNSEQRGVLLSADGMYQSIRRMDVARSAWCSAADPAFAEAVWQRTGDSIYWNQGAYLFLYSQLKDHDEELQELSQRVVFAPERLWLSIPQNYYVRLYYFWAGERGFARENYDARFKLLRELDFTTLAWPEDWARGDAFYQ